MSGGAFPRQQGKETEEWVELRLRDIGSKSLNHLQTHPFGSPTYLELHEPWRGRLYKVAGVYNLAQIYSTSPPFHAERCLSATTGRGDRGVGGAEAEGYRFEEPQPFTNPPLWLPSLPRTTRVMEGKTL